MYRFTPKALDKDEATALGKEYADASSPEERSAIIRRIRETCGEQAYHYALREAGLPLEDALFGSFLPQMSEEGHAKLMECLELPFSGDITATRDEDWLQLHKEVGNSSQIAAIRAAYPDMDKDTYRKICNALTGYVHQTGDASILGGSAQNGGATQTLVLPGDSPVNQEQAARLLKNVSEHDLVCSEKEATKKYAAKVDKDRITNGQWVYSAGHATLMHEGEVVLDNNDHPIQVSLEDLAGLQAGTITVEELREKRKQAGKVPVMTLSGPQGTMGRDQSAEHTPGTGEKLGAKTTLMKLDAEIQTLRDEKLTFVKNSDGTYNAHDAARIAEIDQRFKEIPEELEMLKETLIAGGTDGVDNAIESIAKLGGMAAEALSGPMGVTLNVLDAGHGAVMGEKIPSRKHGRGEKPIKN